MAKRKTDDPFAKVATNIIKKSNANSQNEHYHRWVTRTVREAAEKHAAPIILDRDKIWMALCGSVGVDKAKQLVDE